MGRRQSNNGTSRSFQVQVIGLGLALVLVAISVVFPAIVRPVTAQHRTFTVKQPALTSTHKISAGKASLAKSSKRVRSVKSGPVKAKLNSTLATTACDVTIAPGANPAGMYLPLSAFGVPPIAGVGDDDVIDFNVPAYTFAGETYTRIGISSNGYAIIGGTMDPSDNTNINQDFPDPTKPNNVLAPFWTDLNPESGGTLSIGVLTDGLDDWLVLDWEAVSEFSTINQNSFEMWIGVNSDANPGEDVSYVYGAIQGSGNAGFLTVGAENKLGTHGNETYYNGTGTLPSNGTQLRVTTTSCLEQQPFTTTGSTGTIDEDSLSSASVLNFVLGFNPGTTGTITARYNITATRGISKYCPATLSHIALRFRDSDATGAGGQILLTLHSSNIATGGNNTLYTFDSNVSSQDVGAAFQSYATDVPIDFDFSQNFYWIEAQVIRSNPNVLVHIGSMQIFEADGTACP